MFKLSNAINISLVHWLKHMLCHSYIGTFVTMEHVYFNNSIGLGNACIDWMRPRQLRPCILIQPCSHQTYDCFVVRFTVGGQMHPDCWTEDIRVVRCYFKYVQNFFARQSHVISATSYDSQESRETSTELYYDLQTMRTSEGCVFLSYFYFQ